MKVTETTVRSSMASSQMTGQIDPITSELHRGSLKSMKEFGGEKPSLISRMYQSIKNFFCSIWNFIFGVKVEHGYGEALKAYNASRVMVKELGEHMSYEVYFKCGDAALKTVVSGGEMEGWTDQYASPLTEVWDFQNKVRAWFGSLAKEDRLGEFSIVVCPMDIDPGILNDGVKVGDCIKKYSSKTGKCEFTVEKNIETFEAVQQAKTYEERQEILSKL